MWELGLPAGQPVGIKWRLMHRGNGDGATHRAGLAITPSARQITETSHDDHYAAAVTEMEQYN